MSNDIFEEAQILVTDALKETRKYAIICSLIPALIATFLLENYFLGMNTWESYETSEKVLVAALYIFSASFLLPALLGFPKALISSEGIAYSTVSGSFFVHWNNIGKFEIIGAKAHFVVAPIAGDQIHLLFLYAILKPKKIKFPVNLADTKKFTCALNKCRMNVAI